MSEVNPLFRNKSSHFLYPIININDEMVIGETHRMTYKECLTCARSACMKIIMSHNFSLVSFPSWNYVQTISITLVESPMRPLISAAFVLTEAAINFNFTTVLGRQRVWMINLVNSTDDLEKSKLKRFLWRSEIGILETVFKRCAYHYALYSRSCTLHRSIIRPSLCYWIPRTPKRSLSFKGG